MTEYDITQKRIELMQRFNSLVEQAFSKDEVSLLEDIEESIEEIEKNERDKRRSRTRMWALEFIIDVFKDPYFVQTVSDKQIEIIKNMMPDYYRTNLDRHYAEIKRRETND